MKDGVKDSHTYRRQTVSGWSRDKEQELIHTNNYLLIFEGLPVNCRSGEELTF